MIKINDNNIFVGYIKQLLSSFNLPTCRVLKDTEEEPTKENTKIGDTFLWRSYLYSHGLKVNEDKTTEEVFSKQLYKFGNFIPNFSKKLEIRNNIYDSYTHAYLGNYLRFLRDYRNIDLMSMYNCFTGDSPTVFSIDNVPVANIISQEPTVDVFKTMHDVARYVTSKDGYVVFCLPVKFGKEYTIGLDWDSEVEVFCGFYQNGAIIYQSNSEIESSDDNVVSFMRNTYTNFSGVRLRHPVVYKGLTKFSEEQIEKWHDLESTLTMFIRIQKSCLSSIVVLEGNYEMNTNLLLREANLPAKLCSKNSSECYSKLQLLQINNKKQNLLADRLIEFLSLQAIFPLTDVERNVAKLQATLHKLKKSEIETLPDNIKNSVEYTPSITYGLWDDKIKELINYIIYRLNEAETRNGVCDKYDLTGYCDKDIEELLGFFEYKKEWEEG